MHARKLRCIPDARVRITFAELGTLFSSRELQGERADGECD